MFESMPVATEVLRGASEIISAPRKSAQRACACATLMGWVYSSAATEAYSPV